MMKRAVPLILSAMLLLGPLAEAASKDAVTTMVTSMVRRHHRREKGEDGKWRPEYFTLLMGGQVDGTIADKSVAAVEPQLLAGAIARELSRQNYRFAPDSGSAQLLVLVHWGKTVIPPRPDFMGGTNPSDFSSASDMAIFDADQRHRDAKGRDNARLLGLGHVIGMQNRYWRHLDDLETMIGPRYYVILSAYEFRSFASGQRKLLWRTRMSISADSEKFDDKFMQMLASASKHFGQPTENVVHQYSEPEVLIGTPEVLGIAPDLPAPAPATPDSGK